MAVFATAANGWTPVAHADSAATLADNSYHAVRTETTSTLKVTDIIIGGEATSSTVNRMALRRLSTNASTPTDQTCAAMNPLSQAALSNFYVAATTGPTIAATVHLGMFSLNVFGGVVRWVPPPGEEVWATAATAPNGQLILDSISGTGVVSTSVFFEEA